MGVNNNFRLIRENHTDVLCRHRPDGTCLFVTPSSEEVLGYLPEELVGGSIFDHCHPDDLKKIKADISSENLPDVYRVKFRFRCKDGSYKWLEGTTYNIRKSKKGKITESHTSLSDVSMLKSTEDKLRKNETLLEEVQEIAHAGIFDWDFVNDVVTWSDELLRLYGFKPGDKSFSFRTFVESSLHPDDVRMVDKAIKKALHDQQPFDCEYRVIHPDKSEKYLWLKGKIFFESNKPRRLLGSVFDITKRKWEEEENENRNIAILNAYKRLEVAKEELQKLNDELEQRVFERTRELSSSEQRFRILGESIPQMVWTADADGYIDYYNQNWYNYTGQTFEEAQEWGWKSVQHPEDLEKTQEKWEHSINSGEVFETETRFKRASDGAYMWHIVRAFPLKDDSGKVVKWFGTCTDIDEHQKLNEKKDEFIGIASHELKTPLTSIKAYVQLLERTLKNDENHVAKVYFKNTNTYIDRLNHLIADLLDVAKIQAGKLPFNMSDFNFDELVEEAVANMQYTATTHKIIIEHNEKVITYGDKQRLEQVFINFLTNAIKYSPQAKEIRVNSVVDNGNIIVSVRDYGIGIPKENLVRIFDRFYRVDGLSPKFTGLGIGLYISAEIIQRHHGSTWVESEEGKGSTFFFSIPVTNGKE
jgi:two-component system phosphate regulon sensor histidine kinase PhoR